MTCLRSRVVLLGITFTSLTCMVEASDVTTMVGTSHQGEVISVTEREIQLKGTDGKVTTWKTADVLSVDLSTNNPMVPKDAYVRVQLRDGSQLIAKTLTGQGANVVVTLFSGETLQVPWSTLKSVLFQANYPEHAAEFDALVAQKPKQDLLRLQSRDGKSINTFKGSLGEPDAQGKSLPFQPEGSSQVSLQWERLRGLYFARPTMEASTAVCKVIDNQNNVFAAATVATERRPPLLWGKEEAWVRLQTPAGLQTQVRLASVLRFDFSLGKVVFLSDLDPVRVERASALEENPGNIGYQRNKTLYQTPLSLGGKTYAKGLSLRSRTVLDYDVTGYNRFQALVGIDDLISGSPHALVRIEGDGRELFSTAVTRRDVKPKEVELRINGIKRLRIIVDYGDGFDLGDHVDLVNARIVK